MQSSSYETRLVALVMAVTAINTSLIMCLSPRTKDSGRKYQISWRAFKLFQPVNKTDANGLPSRLMRPDSSQPAQPLVIFLHGAGERGNDNLRQLQNLPEQLASPAWRTRFPCYVLAPQCPSGSYWSDHMEELTSLIEQVIEQHRVDRSRVYLTGLSVGGFGSWELAARRPDLFAAVVPICGGGEWEEFPSNRSARP